VTLGPAQHARPTAYTRVLGEAICRRLTGGELLGRILRERSMPERDTLLRWQREQPEFDRAFARARAAMFEVLAEDVIERADRVTPEEAASHKLYVDAVKWYAGLFGSRRTLETTEERPSIGDAVEEGRAAAVRRREERLREQRIPGDGAE
jgi:hypothetical protein